MSEESKRSKKISEAKAKELQERERREKFARTPAIPFKAKIFSDKNATGTEILIAKIGKSGFLAWSTAPMFRNDMCTVKSVLPITNETVETSALVFKTYDFYGQGKKGHDQTLPHLAEFVFTKLSTEGATAFNRLLSRIDPSTGLPLFGVLESVAGDQAQQKSTVPEASEKSEASEASETKKVPSSGKK